jgi:hypothetical protein
MSSVCEKDDGVDIQGVGKMTPEYRISVEQGIIRVVYVGKAEYAVTRNMLSEVGRLAAETKCQYVLFDSRRADSSNFYLSPVRHAEEAPAMGIDQGFRIALLGAEDDTMLAYFERVAVNRGFQVRTFVDEPAAMAWLRAAA